MPESDRALAPIPRRIVEWDIEGNPVVRTVSVFSRAQVSEIAMAAASQPYVSPEDELAVALGLPTSEFYGMTNLEVMLVKQARHAAESGDSAVVDKVLDRLVGKPKLTTESHHIHESYEQALRRIGQKVVEAEVVRDPLDEL